MPDLILNFPSSESLRFCNRWSPMQRIEAADDLFDVMDPTTPPFTFTDEPPPASVYT